MALHLAALLDGELDPGESNPLLVDSKLTNAEARVEWYFASEQRLSLAGFYKKIDKPIETFITGGDQVHVAMPRDDVHCFDAQGLRL